MLRQQSSAYLIVLTLLLGLAACGEPQRFTALPPGTTVLAFGDSITYGVGAAAQSSYPTQLAASTSWQVVNAGISGDTAREARTRLAPLLTQHQPGLPHRYQPFRPGHTQFARPEQFLLGSGSITQSKIDLAKQQSGSGVFRVEQ